VGLQEAPHLHDPKQNHSENAKCGNSKQEFFFENQPSSSLKKNFKRVALCLHKDNKTDHLEDKKLLTTTKSQESVKLTIDNPQLHTNSISSCESSNPNFQHLESAAWPDI
jgi:hypothetical protein